MILLLFSHSLKSKKFSPLNSPKVMVKNGLWKGLLIRFLLKPYYNKLLLKIYFKTIKMHKICINLICLNF